MLDAKLEHLTFLFLSDILIYFSVRIANGWLKAFAIFLPHFRCLFSSASPSHKTMFILFLRFIAKDTVL